MRFSAGRAREIALMMQLRFNASEITAVRSVISGGKIPTTAAWAELNSIAEGRLWN
jgi:hypothetical protein